MLSVGISENKESVGVSIYTIVLLRHIALTWEQAIL